MSDEEKVSILLTETPKRKQTTLNISRSGTAIEVSPVSALVLALVRALSLHSKVGWDEFKGHSWRTREQSTDARSRTKSHARTDRAVQNAVDGARKVVAGRASIESEKSLAKAFNEQLIITHGVARWMGRDIEVAGDSPKPLEEDPFETPLSREEVTAHSTQPQPSPRIEVNASPTFGQGHFYYRGRAFFRERSLKSPRFLLLDGPQHIELCCSEYSSPLLALPDGMWPKTLERKGGAEAPPVLLFDNGCYLFIRLKDKMSGESLEEVIKTNLFERLVVQTGQTKTTKDL